MENRCKVCGGRLSSLGPVDLPKDTCRKCYMAKRTDLDRTGRSSKKDKFPNPDKKHWLT